MAKRGLAGLSVTEIQRELKRRERGNGRRVRTLMLKREQLQQKLAAIDLELSTLGMRGGSSKGRRRPRNDANLADSLLKLLTGKTFNVTRIAEEVQKAGYTTTSPNFRTIVNQTLIKDTRFKRVGRGQYTAK